MARLILEEGGERRAFRVHKGKLSIGSGEGCALRLVSSDVAEQHAELELGEQGVVLRPRPGVTPPTVGGRPIEKATRLSAQAEFAIGSARFRLEPEEGEEQAAAAPAAAPVRRRAEAQASGANRSRVQTSRPIHKIERGMPTWVILGILAGMGLVAFVLGKAWIGKSDVVQYDPDERLRVAQEAFNIGALDRAEMELGRIDLAEAPQLRDAVASLRSKIADRDDQARIDTWNIDGTTHFDSQIQGFWKKYMQGREVSRPKARVFIKRCQHFEKTWPQHPELDWVRRYAQRYAAIAELDDLGTYEDTAYEIETLTWAKPRNYLRAFELLAEFEARASGDDSAAAATLRAELETARDEYFTDRMLQAKYHYERNEHSHSVAELVHLVIWIGDDSMADEAVGQLELIQDIEGHLRGYQQHKPEKFELLTANELARDLARSKGLI